MTRRVHTIYMSTPFSQPMDAQFLAFRHRTSCCMRFPYTVVAMGFPTASHKIDRVLHIRRARSCGPPSRRVFGRGVNYHKLASGSGSQWAQRVQIGFSGSETILVTIFRTLLRLLPITKTSRFGIFRFSAGSDRFVQRCLPPGFRSQWPKRMGYFFNERPLWGIVASYFGQLGLPG